MFSFFKSNKKHSPVESPDSSDEVVAPSPSQQQDDDFIMIEGRNRRQPLSPYQQSGGVYPSLDGTGAYGGNIGGPYPSSHPGPVKRQDSNANFHYLQGVPFKLSSEIDTGADSTEVQRIQVDEILASLTRMMEMSADYEFKLEQSTVSQ